MEILGWLWRTPWDLGKLKFYDAKNTVIFLISGITVYLYNILILNFNDWNLGGRGTLIKNFPIFLQDWRLPPFFQWLFSLPNCLGGHGNSCFYLPTALGICGFGETWCFTEPFLEFLDTLFNKIIRTSLSEQKTLIFTKLNKKACI